MKVNMKTVFLAFCMGILLPAFLFFVTDKISLRNIEKPEGSAPTQPGGIEENTAVESTIRVLQKDGTVKQMDMENYLTGVLLGEMPADFEMEAFKAQAVVARTYALKRNSGGNKHEAGAVCTDSSCCQSYCPVAEYLAKGGTKAAVNKALTAVKETNGLVLTYNGELIEATYFSCSGGRTEDALAVWGTDIPYLQAVDSPGEEQAAHYMDTVEFSAKDFAKLLNLNSDSAPSSWIGKTTYTQGGGVASIQIAGKTFKGTDMRKILGLRSTAFTIDIVEDRILISTKGFGHRVGMSQYGADAMAVAGSDFRKILMHYYPGTSLETYSQN